MTARIVRLMNDATKEEEIDYLEKIASVGDMTYMASLFTTDLVSWVTSNIRNDFGSDIYGSWSDAVKRADDLERDLKDTKKALEDYQKIVIQEREQRDEREAKLNDQIEKLMKVRSDLLQASSARAEDIYNLTNRLDKYSTEIVQLKAKLYDLEHAND